MPLPEVKRVGGVVTGSVGVGQATVLVAEIEAETGAQFSFAKAGIDQEAASLGAAAVAAVGGGFWDDFTRIDEIIRIESRACPEPQTSAQYRSILKIYRKTWDVLAETAELMSGL